MIPPIGPPLWDRPRLAGDPVRNRRRALLVRRARKLAAEGVLVVGAVPTCAVAEGDEG